MSQECSSTIQNQTNTRIYNRNIPSQTLQPYIDVRAVPTKYSIMPIVDPRREISMELKQRPTYNSQQMFNPGNTRSPWSGFATSINVESELRNQVYALQRCSQSVYVPNSDSDLYNVRFRSNSPQPSQQQPFPDLFRQQKFNEFNPNPNPDKDGLFLNSTRLQVKNIKVDNCS